MQVDTTITIGQLIATAVVLLLALWGGVWALTRMAGTQFGKRMEEKFATLNKAVGDQKTATENGISSLRIELNSHRTSLDGRLTDLSGQTRALERDLLTLKGDLPNHYERRDDAIRREVTIITRLDRIAEKIREKDV